MKQVIFVLYAKKIFVWNVRNNNSSVCVMLRFICKKINIKERNYIKILKIKNKKEKNLILELKHLRYPRDFKE